MTAPPETTESVDDDDLGALYGQVVAAFEEVALLTTSEKVPLNDVLRLVGRRLCELLGVSRCSVYLRREDGLFQGQVGYCAGRLIPASMFPRRDRGDRGTGAGARRGHGSAHRPADHASLGRAGHARRTAGRGP
jgi:hypothetical protein